MPEPKVVKWGILATGGIAETFTKDLTVDPKTRGVTSIKHEIAAAASSSSISRADDFLKKVGAPSSAKAYGSYQELVNDKDVDIIYVATPHSHHYQNARLCLEAGKNVLCEKAFTVNEPQLRKLVEIAKAKNLFLMEAVWTRYFPLSIYVREQITSGRIGTVYRTVADLSMADDPQNKYGPDGNKHRMVNVDLAGGALLDLGIYALTWVFQTLYHTLPEGDRKAPSVLSTMVKYEPTGADESTAMLLTFPRDAKKGGPMHGIATTGLRTSINPDNKGTAGPCVRVYGDKGEIQIFPPTFRPTKTKVILADGTVEDKVWEQPGPGKGSGWTNGFGGTMQAEGEGQGMFWEADEAAMAVVEGRKEGRFEGLEESCVIMGVMDEVRNQNGLVYPEKIESLEYPLEF
ncbi:dimeric dihydrodiol dehydrogenase [Aulographum hederae CBS 113979]|uniref:D-xylose 1-dehydrogenase (NADP(+), D-xylono-1,5-lactone-forming) n=1 Tax=Aulographum hederae CBS 113979 TaxID=1176131 RepID=A0A6G1HAV8_9PEZI|nr:dimeric dihydrodiol dehydrogenase [Aulographum hederae CBS 113979]